MSQIICVHLLGITSKWDVSECRIYNTGALFLIISAQRFYLEGENIKYVD